jgi:hypothetical protein
MRDPVEDLPPVLTVDPDGTKQWRNKDGAFHRLNGPAIEYPDGSKWWYRNGRLHRDDGPAVELAHTIQWWRDGRLHCDAGPAVERRDGTKLWYFQGRPLSQQEMAEIQDRPAAALREKLEEERQAKSADAVQELLRHKASQQRPPRLKK